MGIQKSLKIGQWIVHTHYGLGQIFDVEKKRLGEEEKDYFGVKTSDREYWLALENVNSPRIRILSSKKIFEEALTILQTHPERLPDNYRFRAKYIYEQIEIGTLITLALLIRDIYGKRLEKGLNVSEKQLFKNICERFIDEWILVMRISIDEAQVNLEKAFLQIEKTLKPNWKHRGL